MIGESMDILDVTAMESVCPQTVAGWLWYCDEHDTHGNADSEEEAEHCADAHSEYMLMINGAEDAIGCRTVVWYRTPHERTQ
jgi:hypothetical protein